MVEGFSEKKGDKIMEKVVAWSESFSCSPHFDALSDGEKTEAEPVIMRFANYMYSYFGQSPVEWRIDTMKECCAEILPRKLTTDKSYFEAIAPVLTSFFRYLDGEGLLRSAGILAAEMERLGPEIVANCINPDMWGPAKSFLMNAQASGVDISSPEAISRHMLQYNQQLFENKSQHNQIITPYFTRPTIVVQTPSCRQKPKKKKRSMQKASRRKNR